MLKQLVVPALGLAVVATAATPAAADKYRDHIYRDADIYEAKSSRRAFTTVQPRRYAQPQQRGIVVEPRRYKRKFNPNLDFETEAVWRNLRPSWFDD